MPKMAVYEPAGTAFPPAGLEATPAQPTDSRFHLLHKLPLFADVPEPAMMRLFAKARWRLCAENEVVLDYGDESNDVFFIIEGSVRIVLRTVFGYEEILNDLAGDALTGATSPRLILELVERYRR